MLARSTYLAWAAERYGKVRLDLATSGTPPPEAEDIGDFAGASLTSPSAWLELRAAIARYNNAPTSETVAALGTTQALWLACTALAGPSDAILVEDPGYEPLARIAASVGAQVETFARPPEHGFALDPERVARALKPHTKVVVVTNPHNPSGVRADEETLRIIARTLAERGAFLVVDEVYAPFDGFVDEGGVFHGSARKVGPNVACVSSLGKSYGVGGARVGWLLASSEVIARAEDAVLTTVGALPLSQAGVALRCFERIDHLADRARRLMAGKRERVAAWVMGRGLRWSGPATGLFGFVHLPGSGDLTGFIERAAREREVLVAPGSFFGVPDGFRLAWSARADVLDEGLAQLGEALTKELGR